jgi:acetate kinase
VAFGMKVLALNGGSSSLKCWYHDLAADPQTTPAPQPLWKLHFDLKPGERIEDVLGPALRSLPGAVDVAGHRIVHGGEFRESAVLTSEVRAAIARQAEMAPAHNGPELAAIDTVDRVLGTGVIQVAVFDTAFHATLPPAAGVYAGPYAWLEEGIRRYGFHGISHQYAARRAAELLGSKSRRLITCHLGNGASLAAVRAGRSIDTTMGFTPLEGLMMGSRSGSVDPGILVHLMRRGATADQLDEVLNRHSGLLGISGISGDMREILAAAGTGHERARLAFEIYTHRLVREMGGMLAVLGGLDALVFTGGVGENCPPLREAAANQFAFLGMKLDPGKNDAPHPDQDVAAADSAVRVLVIHAEEEWEIARECYRLARFRRTRRNAPASSTT